jgi:hypothetical protein
MPKGQVTSKEMNGFDHFEYFKLKSKRENIEWIVLGILIVMVLADIFSNILALNAMGCILGSGGGVVGDAHRHTSQIYFYCVYCVHLPAYGRLCSPAPCSPMAHDQHRTTVSIIPRSASYHGQHRTTGLKLNWSNANRT